MPQAIVTSDEQSRHSHLITLNIAGVLIFIFIEVLLLLTALGVIFVEPDIAPVLQHHLNNYAPINIELSARHSGDGPCCAGHVFEDAYMFYLNLTS